MRDLHNNVVVGAALTSQTISTDTTTAGEIIDTREYEGFEFIIQSGTLTDGAYAILIQDGDVANLSDAASVADKFLLGTEADAGFALADDDTVKSIGYKRHGKRYVRLSVVSTSTTSGGVFGAVVVKTALVRPTH